MSFCSCLHFRRIQVGWGCFVWWGLCCVLQLLSSPPYYASASECNVMDYGAKGDGVTDDTHAIQRAFDACNNTDDGQPNANVVVFPSNFNFLTFPFVIKYNNTQVLISEHSTITASPDWKHWPGCQPPTNDCQHLITTAARSAHYLHNITISGHGLINGNGAVWWPMALNKSISTRPWLIRLQHIMNLNVSYLTLLNSPMFHLFSNECTNVWIHNINITSPNYTVAPNTDGIDIGSTNVHVFDCYVENGDDSYCIKAGANNVLIENSVCKYGMGLDANSEPGDFDAHPPMQNILFRNMTCDQTWYGIRIKSGEKPGNDYNGTFVNITFQDIHFHLVQKAIDINQFNESETKTKSKSNTAQTGEQTQIQIQSHSQSQSQSQSQSRIAKTKRLSSSLRLRTKESSDSVSDSGSDSESESDSDSDPRGYQYSLITNITYKDISGTYTEYAGHLDCDESSPCKYLVFENINLVGQGSNAADWQCSANVYGTAVNVTPALNCLE